MQDQVRQANDAHNATKQELTKVNEELHKAKQESRKRRKQITAQQSIMGLGPNGYHKVCMFDLNANVNPSSPKGGLYQPP